MEHLSQIDKGLISLSLNQKDIFLVKRQCELQHATTPEEVIGFGKAYAKAKDLAASEAKLQELSGEDVHGIILEWAELIDKGNSTGFRVVPVRFANYSTAVAPDSIPRAMQVFTEMYAENSLTPIEAYTEFEKIHPFKDGNGRVGDLLWKVAMARNDGRWPEELPPDVFGVHE